MDQAMEKAREAGLVPEGWILSRLTQCLIAALPIAPIAVPPPLRSATKRMQTATS